MSLYLHGVYRSSMSTRRRYKLSFIQSRVQLHTTLSCCQRRLRRSVLSVKVCCGVWLVRVCDVRNVDSQHTRNAKIYSMLTAFNVSLYFHCIQ